MNYYNEFDPKAAAWLRELIAAGLIPQGDVDERSITEVLPGDLEDYTQCHFFAGIGGWAYALRLADWRDDRPVWTGSCPCQPFSVAGRGKGTADSRHLWPAFRWLIAQCRPGVVFGEQVASKAGRAWLGGVQNDLETMGYIATGADLCAASVNAPHIRQRLWWVGRLAQDSAGVRRGGGCDGDQTRDQREVQAPGLGDDGGLGNASSSGQQARRDQPVRGEAESQESADTVSRSRLAHSESAGDKRATRPTCEEERRQGSAHNRELGGAEPTQRLAHAPHPNGRSRESTAQTGTGENAVGRGRPAGCESDGGLGNPCSQRRQQESRGPSQDEEANGREGRDGGKQDSNNQLTGSGPDGRLGNPRLPEQQRRYEDEANCSAGSAARCDEGHESAPPNGDVNWSQSIYWPCRDGKWRRVPAVVSEDGTPSPEPSLFPLADGVPGRVGLLRGAGNAIVPQVAAEFIMAYKETQTND